MPTRDSETGLFDSENFIRLVGYDLVSAAKQEQPYSVIVCFPQHFSDEHLDELVKAAAKCVQALVRDHDLAGRLAEDVLAIGLPNTAAEGARVLAYRLKGDLAAKTAHLRSSVWETGYACLPDDGTEATDLLEAAYQSAKHERDARAPGSELPRIPLGLD